jgi:AraC family transcriptional regulator of adaptative response / DNA-3-methyladenine glycosylase II
MELNQDICYRALSTRDSRFDGLFFVGVKSTGIYCRPICPTRTPRRESCRFFPSAAAAERHGFRPCLRCRPELAPGRSPIEAGGQVARHAAARIEAGALNNGGSLDQLAREVGLSARQLRRIVRQELGVSPVELAQTHRLLLAKQLLTETPLPVTEVAFASGFSSVRRFNALFQSHYRLSPSRFRRSVDGDSAGAPVRLRLSYRPPLAWGRLLGFLNARTIAGVEAVNGASYIRTVAIGQSRGWLKVSPHPAPNSLAVEFAPALTPVLAQLLPRLRHLFDLNARPDLIAEHLSADPRVGRFVREQPGLRIPGAFSGFEMACRAILGQRISVRSATTLARRLAAEFGDAIETPDPALSRLSPTPERLAAVEPEALRRLGITRERAHAITALARAVADGELRLEPGVDPESAIGRLKEFPGIGEWTAHAIAMRALAWPDAFPHGDLGLLRGLGEDSATRLRTAAEAWRPWRAYAAMHVWNAFAQPKE